MGTESIEASFLSMFALISFFIFLLVSKYSHIIKETLIYKSRLRQVSLCNSTTYTPLGGKFHSFR